MNIEAILTALLIPFAGTALGSAFVFFMKKEIPNRMQKALLGFASGVMVAASVWSLLIPSMEMGAGNVWPAVIGLLDGYDFSQADGRAVGVAIAGAMNSGFSMAGALALSLGIAIQNIPEGAIISMPLRAAGNSRRKTLKPGDHRLCTGLCTDDGAGCCSGIMDSCRKRLLRF